MVIDRPAFQYGGLSSHPPAFDHFNLAVSKTTDENIYQVQIPFEHPTGKRSDEKALLKLEMKMKMKMKIEMEVKEAGIRCEMSEAEDGE